MNITREKKKTYTEIGTPDLTLDLSSDCNQFNK